MIFADYYPEMFSVPINEYPHLLPRIMQRQRIS